jgi:hypothetical protein
MSEDGAVPLIEIIYNLERVQYYVLSAASMPWSMNVIKYCKWGEGFRGLLFSFCKGSTLHIL